MIHPWLQETWQRLVGLGARLPHALLFVGPEGLGKRDLADALAARLLCATPGADGHACGHCAACQLRLSGNHPDLLPVVPEADAASGKEPGDGDDAGEGEGGSGKKKSSQIRIEQIRDLQEALAVTGHQSSRRVIVVDPAEAMNAFTANALLKLLEEPPEGCVFLLVSSAPRRLLPTIRSRCQQWSFSRPAGEAVAQWLSASEAPPADLLALTGGMPLAAQRLARNGSDALLRRFVKDLAQLPAGDPLKLAGQWESWLKSKEALAAGFGMPQLVEWMQRWVTDLASLRLGGRVRFFPGEDGVIAALAQRTSVATVTNCYNELARIRRVAQHPLNARLMLEDMLLRYARAVTGTRR
ncbi:DNA polymerase III subunit delta' [Azoarcus sp. DN11]|uniref:DNA polymerase III subunit delta' n=1 Tax=Azoarcus sp. DN11 TaxID=356837 RepID=UPI000EB1E81E|nr:DNA polymerase III subunit delta' [Azoarcus sp. DN11]AYH44755.1 DNA polymerase III subunit delta' [Azoarcus sp. DN11]